jgi:ABC-2 type transport system permease protein
MQTAIIMDYQKGSPMTGSFLTPLIRKRKCCITRIKRAYNFVPGVMAMVLLLVCTMMTAITIVQRKRNGHHGSNACFSMKPLMVVIAKQFHT